MKNVIKLSIIMLNVVILSVTTLNVIMPNVFILSVGPPLNDSTTFVASSKKSQQASLLLFQPVLATILSNGGPNPPTGTSVSAKRCQCCKTFYLRHWRHGQILLQTKTLAMHKHSSLLCDGARDKEKNYSIDHRGQLSIESCNGQWFSTIFGSWTGPM